MHAYIGHVCVYTIHGKIMLREQHRIAISNTWKAQKKNQTAKWSSSTKRSWSCSFGLWFIHPKINNYSYLRHFWFLFSPPWQTRDSRNNLTSFWVSWWVKEHSLHQLGAARHISVTLLQPEWPCVEGLSRQLQAEISGITPSNKMHQGQSISAIAESRRIFLSHRRPRWLH